jgi:hypothetical protein
LYIWDDLKIYVEGENFEFISGIKKYFFATEAKIKRDESDIVFLIYDEDENKLPRVNKNARLVNSYTLILEKETSVSIYAHNEELWYIYQDIAGIWIDNRNNTIILSLSKELYSFVYYNALFFFLYPLSVTLENFGYFNAHASCVSINKRAVLFTGNSGAGKSTSAFAIASNGGSIISDDMTFIKKTGNSYKPYSITKLVKLRNDIIVKFSPWLLKYKALEKNEEEAYFDVNDINGKNSQGAEISAIIILEKTGAEGSDIMKIHPSKVVPHIFPSSIQTSIDKFAHREFIFFTEMLNDTNCYKVNFGIDVPGFYKTIKDLFPK